MKTHEPVYLHRKVTSFARKYQFPATIKNLTLKDYKPSSVYPGCLQRTEAPKPSFHRSYSLPMEHPYVTIVAGLQAGPTWPSDVVANNVPAAARCWIGEANNTKCEIDA